MFLTNQQALEIRQQFNSPTFVNSALLMRQAAEEALAVQAPFGLTVRYALKANSVRGVIQLFDQLDLHFDASSIFEVQRAIAAGIKSEKIQLTAQELPTDRSDWPIGVQVNACSLQQISQLAKLLPVDQTKRSIGLRINPGIGSGHHIKTMVGGSYAGFGIWHEDLAEARAQAQQHGLQVTRLHAHVGSGTAIDMTKKVIQELLKIADHIPAVQVLNLGGGFPVARTSDQTAVAINTVLNAPCQLLTEYARRSGRQLRLEIEPGAYLMANAGVLLASVVDVKRSGPNWFVVLDTGLTEIMRPTLYGAQHPIRLVPAAGHCESVSDFVVIGHCCESGDVLTVADGNGDQPEARALTRPRPGDIMLIGGTGAYCSAMCAKNYNSFPEAAEVMLTETGDYKLIRRRQSLAQLIVNEL
ncbi:diaminopimelate decarboxylase [Patescibacteria group bacterium]|nr:diaminopimelate decarboxylase [Patescibacteria group bacterium]MBU1028957.1 diaminopimelate decarboxylase [Patescibacteria group bacterium]